MTSVEYLDQFWKLVRSGIDRLVCLQVATQWTVYNRKTYHVRRAESMKLPRANGLCWACERSPASERHHIIMVCNGGSNDDRNIVPLCRTCHDGIHPWSKDKRRKTTRKAARQRMRAANEAVRAVTQPEPFTPPAWWKYTNRREDRS